MRAIIVATILLLAGCAVDGGGPSGSMALTVADNRAGVELVLAGAWAQRTDGTWHSFAEANATLTLDGEGEEQTSGGLPQGDYGRIRVKFTTIRVDGADLLLAEDGFDLPLDLTVRSAAEVRIEFDWNEAIYTSVHGPTFIPVLAGLRLAEDGEATIDLERKEISGTGTMPPVARIQAFDATELQIFLSDFVADSPEQRVLGTSGTLRFSASESEAVEPGTQLVSFTWDFGDGAATSGSSVEHTYPEDGGNFTVRLTVTDSLGATDSQALKVALLPALAEETFNFDGRVTGTGGSPQGDGGVHDFEVDPLMLPDGREASGITSVRALLLPQGSLLPGTDLDLRVRDGASREIGSAATASGTESFEEDIEPDRQPAAGAWTAEARPDPAIDAPYSIEVTVRWQLAGNERFIEWARSYDDGHDHEH